MICSFFSFYDFQIKMTNRWQLLKTHKLSAKRGFSIEDYNLLSHEYALVCEQIDRLEDELQVNIFLSLYLLFYNQTRYY
jgi:hypothetical protein